MAKNIELNTWPLSSGIFFSFPLSCRCTLPENPNNHTLQYWKEHNIVTAEVHWANLTVTVSLGAARWPSIVTARLKEAFSVAVGSPSASSGIYRNKAFYFFKLFLLIFFPFKILLYVKGIEKKIISLFSPTSSSYSLPSDPVRRICEDETRQGWGQIWVLWA